MEVFVNPLVTKSCPDQETYYDFSVAWILGAKPHFISKPQKCNFFYHSIDITWKLYPLSIRILETELLVHRSAGFPPEQLWNEMCISDTAWKSLSDGKLKCVSCKTKQTLSFSHECLFAYFILFHDELYWNFFPYLLIQKHNNMIY